MIGVREFTVLFACCLLPLLLVAGAGGIFALVKLGVIGNYWLKGDKVEQGGNYTLDQSKDTAEENK